MPVKAPFPLFENMVEPVIVAFIGFSAPYNTVSVVTVFPFTLPRTMPYTILAEPQFCDTITDELPVPVASTLMVVVVVFPVVSVVTSTGEVGMTDSCELVLQEMISKDNRMIMRMIRFRLFFTFRYSDS